MASCFYEFRWSLIAGRIPGRTSNDVKNYWNTHLRSYAKQQKKEPEDAKSSKDCTMVTIIKPQPHTLSKPLYWFKDDNQIVETHNNGTLIRSSNDGVDNNYNMSPGLISSPTVLDNTINGFLKELFDEGEKIIDSEIGWSFDGSQTKGEALNVAEDNENSFFDFSTDEVMWNLLDSEQL
ncbi:Homeodomain-like protein [Cynara cardunculus var. scolymus]|uniref:Homeodomain-like protein n=1 Tax=Cynara cardunculus var. scolymus TaxID=59895 RepID=A0A103Y589_CYNCS|nr:Homeodomain-like protein [Cynara cardunculus var. scolymus]